MIAMSIGVVKEVRKMDEHGHHVSEHIIRPDFGFGKL